jgi:hypothetical protein
VKLGPWRTRAGTALVLPDAPDPNPLPSGLRDVKIVNEGTFRCFACGHPTDAADSVVTPKGDQVCRICWDTRGIPHGRHLAVLAALQEQFAAEAAERQARIESALG